MAYQGYLGWILEDFLTWCEWQEFLLHLDNFLSAVEIEQHSSKHTSAGEPEEYSETDRTSPADADLEEAY